MAESKQNVERHVCVYLHIDDLDAREDPRRSPKFCKYLSQEEAREVIQFIDKMRARYA